MRTKQRTYYDREFKQKAVELSYARGNAKEIAEELGIRPELLYPGIHYASNEFIEILKANKLVKQVFKSYFDCRGD